MTISISPAYVLSGFGRAGIPQSLLQHLEHHLPQVFVWEHFDLDALPGFTEGHGIQFFPVLLRIALRPDAVESGFGHLDEHLDKAIGAESLIASEMPVAVLVECVHAIDDLSKASLM